MSGQSHRSETSRREFVKLSAFGLASLAVGGFGSMAQGIPPAPLLSGVAAVCRRLAPLGWRELLLDVTGGQLDILARDLDSELLKPLSKIDRSCPGFGDFALRGSRAIEPGEPDHSLLYHALAAPTVVANRQGKKLAEFPTLAEIETIENYVYATRKATLDELRGDLRREDFGIVVFALHYRNTPMSVTGRHAQLCFSRTGITHLGTLEPAYDAERRSFANIDESRPFDFRVTPRRFAAYLAKRISGFDGKFGLQDPQAGDDVRAFWVPVHKLFSGKECLAGLDLHIEYSSGMRNDELASFHRVVQGQGLTTGWTGKDLEQHPFVIKDEKIASLSRDEDLGEGVMVPLPAPLIREAEYQGKPLTFPFHNAISRSAKNMQFSSYFVMPNAGLPVEPGYYHDADQDSPRNAPEYINVRHRVRAGKVESLNPRPDMMDVIRKGGFDALHYIDSAGDGWVAVTCAELQSRGVTTNRPAFCLAGLPDFLPKINQRDLMRWWKTEVPQPMRATLWSVPPLALSHARIAANVELPVDFDLMDKTVTAIVSQLSGSGQDVDSAPLQTANGPLNFEKVGLPDGSPGLFDPGWDVSIGVRSMNGGDEIHKYLVGHGLGSPFIEDAKLCAALGAYWPGLAPDATRQYQPAKYLDLLLYPWPSIVPLTDEELGMVPSANGKMMSWDGVAGPKRRKMGDRDVIAYQDIEHVDYIDTIGTMTAVLTARTEPDEYKARILAMAAVYWSLGIHEGDLLHPDNYKRLMHEKSLWAVLSFQRVAAEALDLKAISQAAKHTFTGPHIFRFEIFRWGEHSEDPGDHKVVLVEMEEEVVAYSDGRRVIKQSGDTWVLDATIPT
jgi:hypothetical protein